MKMEKDMKNISEQKPICIIEVNENIRRVETGQPLTRSLRVLNTSCDFKKKYEEKDMIIHNTSREKEIKERNRTYRLIPEVREKQKKLSKEYQKKYNQRPEVKERIKLKWKEKMENPEFREKQRLLAKKNYYRNREKNLKLQKEYYYRNKEKILKKEELNKNGKNK